MAIEVACRVRGSGLNPSAFKLLFPFPGIVGKGKNFEPVNQKLIEISLE